MSENRENGCFGKSSETLKGLLHLPRAAAALRPGRHSHKVTALGFAQELSWTASKPGMKLGGHLPSELKSEGYLGHARQVFALELCKSIQMCFPEVFFFQNSSYKEEVYHHSPASNT